MVACPTFAPPWREFVSRPEMCTMRKFLILSVLTVLASRRWLQQLPVAFVRFGPAIESACCPQPTALLPPAGPVLRRLPGGATMSSPGVMMGEPAAASCCQ